MDFFSLSFISSMLHWSSSSSSSSWAMRASRRLLSSAAWVLRGGGRGVQAKLGKTGDCQSFTPLRITFVLLGSLVVDLILQLVPLLLCLSLGSLCRCHLLHTSEKKKKSCHCLQYRANITEIALVLIIVLNDALFWENVTTAKIKAASSEQNEWDGRSLGRRQESCTGPTIPEVVVKLRILSPPKI